MYISIYLYIYLYIYTQYTYIMDYTGIYTHQLPICVPQLQLGARQLPLRALELPDHVAWAVPR